MKMTRQFSNGDFNEIANEVTPKSEEKKVLVKLNIYAVLMVFVLMAITFVVIPPDSVEFTSTGVFIFFVSFILYIVVHELLHGLAFVLFGKVKIKELKFGIVLKSGMAYCVSTVPVQIKSAKISLMMPVYVVCIPLYVYSIVVSNILIAFVALMYFSGSIADLYYMLKVRKYDKNLYLFEELSSKNGYDIGFKVYEKIEQSL